MKDKWFNIRITKELLDTFSKKCKEVGESKTEAITRCIKFYCQHKPRGQENE